MLESYNNFIKAFAEFINEFKPFLFCMFITGLIVFAIELCCRFYIYGLSFDQVIYCLWNHLDFEEFSKSQHK